MKNLEEKLVEDLGLESELLDDIKYETSFFVKYTSSKKNWYIKNIDMDESDQDEIIKMILSIKGRFVDEYKVEDRDPEFIYEFNVAGLLVSSNRIQVAFADSSEENTDTLPEGEEQQYEISIHNYDGSGYPPNDEVKLIVHRLLLGNSYILAFCYQSRTSLATTNIKTIFNNKLKNIKKNNFYKINNEISFLMTASSYYIASVNYFENIFSFDSEISRRKDKALNTLEKSELIDQFNIVLAELKKGYMARSVSMIRMNESEMKKYVDKNKKSITKFCIEFQVGVRFDENSNKFTVTDGKLASLFLTYLFSSRMAQNIEGDLVYYKTYGKLSKANSVTAQN